MQFKRKHIFPILVFTVILILFFNLGQWFLFSKMRDFAESVFRDNLVAQAELAASGFDGEVISQIQSETFFPPDLVNVKQRLNRLKDNHSYFNVRLLDLFGDPVLGFNEFDTSEFSLEYDLAPFISATAGISSSSKLISKGSLYLISAYAPVTLEKDSVIAVLGLDADYEFFKSLADFKENLVYMSIISLAFVIVFAIAFILINRRLMSAQEAIYQASALSSMGRMAATMAHEIKNPLGIIKATGERIRKKYSGDSDDRVFDFISEEVDRLNSILADYLDFARPADPMNKREKTNLHEMVAELIKQCRTDFSMDKIEVEFRAVDNPMPVRIEKNGLKQAILNLFMNARDSCPEDGKIRIELESNKDNNTIKIIDHGGGIKKEIRKKLFEPFATTKARGSGLGLYVSRKIIKQNDGELTLYNNKEGGATAEIKLPTYEEN